MREITTHHDGHGLAESIKIEADEIPEEERFGGASHYYKAWMSDGKAPYPVVLSVQFQKGPRGDARSLPGVIDNVLLAIVADRMSCFMDGPFNSEQNGLAYRHVIEAMAALRRRADERAARGVLGKAEP